VALTVAALVASSGCGGGAKGGVGNDAGGNDVGGNDAGGNDGGAPPPPLNIAWDWVGIVGTGQSLSVGAFGTPVLAMSPSFGNLKLDLGGATLTPPAFSGDDLIASLSMKPLDEPIRPLASGYPAPYPANLYGETPHTAMASEITTLAEAAVATADYVTVHTVVGESGQPMSVIDKAAVYNPTMHTGLAYQGTLFEARAITRLAAAAGKTYGIGGIVLTHGESDAGNTNYANAVHQLWSDYNADLAAITGQTASIPLFASQQHSVPSGSANQVAESAIQVWKAGTMFPGDVVCTGPKYQYSYMLDPMRVHMTALEYEKLGEKTGQVYFERVVLGHDWQPLQPTSATVSGNTIAVQFHVPVPPLQWDQTLPPPHPTGAWANGRGFEVRSSAALVNITSVDITADDTVTITCDQDLTGKVLTVSYAMINDYFCVTSGNMCDPATSMMPPNGMTFRWGHLRDSDPFVGAATQAPQPNYCVAFRIQPS
jgi:hypothetical protein